MAGVAAGLVLLIASQCAHHTAADVQETAVVHHYIHPKAAFALEMLSVELQTLPPIILSTDLGESGWKGQAVTVRWEGVLYPRPYDIIAVYVPADADPKLVVPSVCINASEADEQYLSTGSGSVTVNLTNMRQSFGFKFIKGGVVRPKVVAEAITVENLLHAYPTSGHLALHADGKSMVVQWVSSSSKPQLLRYSLEDAGGSSERADRGDGLKQTGAAALSLGQQQQQQQLAKMRSSHHTASRRMIKADAAAGAGLVLGDEKSAASHWQHTIPSSTATYSAADMCGAPANSAGWLDPGFIHTAIIDAAGLPASTRFFYQYGSEEGGWSPMRSALSPPVAASPEPFTFLAFNDVSMTSPILFDNHCPPRCPEGLHFAEHYGENSSKLVPLLESETDAQLAILVGDLAYAVGYGPDWDVFGQQFERAFTSWPLMVGTGNHERDFPNTGDAFANVSSDSGGECNVPFTYRFYTPTAHSGDEVQAERDGRQHKIAGRPHQDPRISYYSFEMGSVHFLILDSETPSSNDTDQGRFVAKDLAAVDRSRTPWIVVGLHRMMVAPATWCSPYVGDVDVQERLQSDYEDLFFQHGVDVVIQGHEHAYARSCMYYKGNCVDGAERDGAEDEESDSRSHPSRAPVYVLAGHAGAGFTHGFPKELPHWVVSAFEGRNGYLRFTASAHQLIMEAVSSDDGSNMDHFSLKSRQRVTELGQSMAS